MERHNKILDMRKYFDLTNVPDSMDDQIFLAIFSTEKCSALEQLSRSKYTSLLGWKSKWQY